MADNTQLNTGTGGDTIRDKDRAGVKTQIVGLDLNPAGSEVLGTGDATNGLDVDVTRVQGTVTVSGTVTANLAAGTNNVGDVDVLTMPATAADGGVQPATTVVVSGNDGTNVQTLKTDVNGILQTGVNGTVAVTDNGGSLTVDGTVTVDSELTTADLDTGAGTDTRAVVGLALAASGGAVLAGSANPVPVSGTVTANAGTGTMAVSAASLPLPSGASTAAKQPALGTAGAASADVLTVQGVASMTALKVDGSAVTQPVSGTVTANAGTGTFATSLSTLPALVTGSALVGRVNVEPQTANGLTPSVTISAASTNATSVKASAGQLYSIFCSNTNAAVRFLKLYNKASAPTVGTDTPVLVFAIPGNTAGAGFSWSSDMGVAFGTGLAFALTTGVAHSDTAAVAANEIVVNLGYK